MTTAVVVLKPAIKLEVPPMFNVMIHNDDYTPFIFVIEVLMDLFRHTETKAEEIAQEVHDRGQASAGLFTRDVAETKANQVAEHAKRAEFPLKASVEKAL